MSGKNRMHSEGPWIAHLIEHLIGHDFPQLWSTRVNGAHGGAVAMAIGKDKAECTANALLISAAPQLLAEAKVLRCLVTSPRFRKMNVDEALQELRANDCGHDGGVAISKAEGTKCPPGER
jgi:hypothetical protein